MKKVSALLLAGAIGVTLLVYMVAFQVRFNEVAVVTTFGKASEGSIKNTDGKGAGLYLKWPWPIQDVRRYDARVRILEDRLEQQETLDKQVVILSTYVSWKIGNPLDFYRSMRNEQNAERYLLDRLRTARAEVGNYSFDDLTNVDPAALKLAEVEEAVLRRMRTDISSQQYGVEVDNVGIKRIILPQDVAEKVFERMSLTRQRLAQSARSEGEAVARSIRARARSAQQRILAFADRRAQDIRSEGDQAAARYYATFARNEDFAIFIRKLESLETTLANNTTFLLDTRIVPFDVLEEGAAAPGAAPPAPAAGRP